MWILFWAFTRGSQVRLSCGSGAEAARVLGVVRRWHHQRQVSGTEKLLQELPLWETSSEVPDSARRQVSATSKWAVNLSWTETSRQPRGTGMDSRGCSGDPAAESSGSARREEPSSGGRPELLVYLTSLQERYGAAKFSLAAYLLCWALLRWYRVRFFTYMLSCDFLKRSHSKVKTLSGTELHFSGP